MKPLMLVAAACLLPAGLAAQFFLNGAARLTADSCFQLTSETNFEVGSIWYPDKIDLRNS